CRPSTVSVSQSVQPAAIRAFGDRTMPPLPPGYDNTIAKELGAACQLAYLQDLHHPAFLAHVASLGYTLVAEFTADLFGSHELFGYAMKSQAQLIVAFRGTETILDVLADADYAQHSLDLSPGLPSAGQTHVGFTSVYLSFRTYFLNVLHSQPALPT